jgi:hypothetical protein
MGKRKVQGSSTGTVQQRRHQHGGVVVNGHRKTTGGNDEVVENVDGVSCVQQINRANIKSTIMAHKIDKRNKLERTKWINRLLVTSIFSLLWLIGIKLSGGGLLSSRMIGTSVVAEHKDFLLLSSSFSQEQESADDESDLLSLNKTNLESRLAIEAAKINDHGENNSVVIVHKNRSGKKRFQLGRTLMQNLFINPVILLRNGVRNLFSRISRNGEKIL